jgi:hypothetical protein
MNKIGMRVGEEPDGPTISALGVRSQKLSNIRKGRSSDGRLKIYDLELLRSSEGTRSHSIRTGPAL